MSDLAQKRREVRQRLIDENEFPNIPDKWGVERLRFLFTESRERNGETPVGEMLSVSEYHGVVPREYEHEEQKRTDGELENYWVVKPGQLAVNSMWLNHLGLGVSEHIGHVSPAYNVYDISNRLERRFVHHLVRSNYYLKIYLRYLYGIRPNSFQIKSNDWASIPIIVPDLDTQKAIAAFLDRETARIDRLIEKKERQQQRLQERQAIIITHVVRGEAEDSNADDKRPVRLRFVVALNPSKSEAGDLSSYGLVTFAPMDAIAEGLGGLDTSIERPADELADGSYNYFAEGDILLAKVTPCFENGKKALIAALPNRIGFATSEVHVVRPKPTGIDPNYLRYLLCSEDFRAAGIASMTGAGGLRRISDSAIKDFPLPVASLDRQREIAAKLDAIAAHIQKLRSRVKRSIDLLTEKRAALITTAVTGQIDVRKKPPAIAAKPDRRLDAIQDVM